MLNGEKLAASYGILQYSEHTAFTIANKLNSSVQSGMCKPMHKMRHSGMEFGSSMRLYMHHLYGRYYIYSHCLGKCI
jgi:hypothetical protein